MQAVPVPTGTVPAEAEAVSSAAGAEAATLPQAPFLSIAEQLRSEKARIASKYRGHAYIAYFQAYTNTYGPVNVLERAFFQAIEDPEVKVLSIATRPDCLPPEILNLLGRLNRIKPVWIELGLQTIHASTAAYIRRGYPLSVFEEAVRTLRAIGISVIVHTILYLPGESKAQMLETIEYLNLQEIQGIKLQLLHVLRDTDLYNDYQDILSRSRPWKNIWIFSGHACVRCGPTLSSTV